MIVYVALVLILVIIAFWGRICKQSQLLYYTILLIIIIFTAFRDSIGVDTASYQDIYYRLTLGHENTHAEIGYLYINKIAALLKAPYVIVQLLTVGLSVFFLHLFIKSSIRVPEQGFALIVFLCSTLYLSYYCSGVRQGIAISVCLYASRYIINRKFTKFILVVGFATLFHKSAICFIPGYVIYRKKIKILYLILLFVVAYFLAPYVKVVFDILISYVTGHYMGYATLFNGDANAKSGLGIIARVMIWVTVVLLAYRSTKPIQEREIILTNLFIVGICLYLLNRNVDILNRFNEYYLCYAIAVFTYILNAFKGNSKHLVFIVSCFLVIGLFISFIMFVGDAFIPYRSYLTSLL